MPKLYYNFIDIECGNLNLVHYVGTLIDGTKFEFTRDREEPLGGVVKGLDHGVVSMKKGEIALFTLPAELGYGVVGGGGFVVLSNAVVRFEVELVSWITVVDLSKDGGIVKKIIEKGERNERPGDLDEVLGTLMPHYLINLSSLLVIILC